MKTLLMGEHTELPIVLRHMLKLRHGQLIFKGIWNGLVGENCSDFHAVIQVHDQRLIDLLFRNGVLGAAEGFIRGYWSSEDLVNVIRILARNRDVLDRMNQNMVAKASQLALKAWYKSRKNSIDGSRQNIAEHYDLSNDFFKPLF
jgi:cyclopropane-fatty-acyl-phospholipid synthase